MLSLWPNLTIDTRIALVAFSEAYNFAHVKMPDFQLRLNGLQKQNPDSLAKRTKDSCS